jgi:hypothetical protein
MTAWRPGNAWFMEKAPALVKIAERVAAMDKLKPVWANNED